MAPRPTKKSPGLPAPQPPPRPDLALQARPPAHPDLSATPRPAAATMECIAQMMGGKKLGQAVVAAVRSGLLQGGLAPGPQAAAGNGRPGAGALGRPGGGRRDQPA